MNGYLPVREACDKTGMTLYFLNKLIDEGKVRMHETSNITKRRNLQIRLVCTQDIMDAQSGVELRYIDIKSVGDLYGITPNAVQYQIKRNRLRWRRNGMHLQVCVSDLKQFLQPIGNKPDGSPKGTPDEPA